MVFRVKLIHLQLQQVTVLELKTYSTAEKHVIIEINRKRPQSVYQ